MGKSFMHLTKDSQLVPLPKICCEDLCRNMLIISCLKEEEKKIYCKMGNKKKLNIFGFLFSHVSLVGMVGCRR